MIGGHGNNIYQYEGVSIKADFSSNIAFNNHAEQIIDQLSQHMSSLRNYPDPVATKLTAQIALLHGVDSDQVLVTNGSAEAFYLVAHYLSAECEVREVRACRTAITIPSFAEYEDSCRLHNHEISFVEFSQLADLPIDQFDSLWLASPNNPDGYRVAIADIAAMAKRGEGCKIVLDRAYNELSSDGERCGEMPENVILIESFTKLYGIPGLRLGYIVASRDVIAALTTMRPPWSVNSLSLVAGEYILSNMEALRPSCSELVGESLYLQEMVGCMEGRFRVVPSHCNFFLVEILGAENAEQLYDYLLQEHGLLIRNASNFRGLSDKYFRVAAQERSLNDKLIEALRQWR